MNPELLYFIKVNAALIVFYLFYWLFLRRDTFYNWKRWYFLAAPLLSFIFPLIDFSFIFLAAPVQTIRDMTFHFPVYVSGAAQGYSIQDAILFLAGGGAVALLARLCIQLASLRKIHCESAPAGIFQNCRVRNMNVTANPFSFFRTIYINPVLHNAGDLKTILSHEQIHASQWHSIDILLFETVYALCWYNPFVWLLRQSVRQNIEFYVDKQILEAGYDRRQYQQELLKVSQIPAYGGIANNFNINHLKKRITMMNKKNSNRMQLLKFALVIPVFAGMTVIANDHLSLIPQDKQVVSISVVDVQDSEKIVLNEKVHDFQTIKEKDGPTSTVFQITNNTGKPLVITNVKSSCGCTTPEWTKEPIAPGKTGHVKATYNPSGRSGPFDKIIVVSTNSDPATIELRIKGTVEAN